MKIVILGAGGQLGRQLAQVLPGELILLSRLDADLTRASDLRGLLNHHRPHVVVNAAAYTHVDRAEADPAHAFAVNALAVRDLARTCSELDCLLIHFSTDCVFSGARGRYTEDDFPDATDLYGRTKLLGELSGAGELTLRTSMIGHELGSRQGLVEWFLAQSGIDHVVFEKHRAGHVWRAERWDTFCLVTPNWQCQLPGWPYRGEDPEGFMLRDEIVDYVRSYAASFAPPVHEGVAGREFVIVVSGRVRVERKGRKVNELGPGDFLGEIALIDHGPRTATVAGGVHPRRRRAHRRGRTGAARRGERPSPGKTVTVGPCGPGAIPRRRHGPDLRAGA